jgi:alpha-glucosidase
MPVDEPWWKSAVIYQIYPRSFQDTPTSTWADGGARYRENYPDRAFADSNGDGVGDLEGVRRHLDHLTWLGVDAIWLSPFFRSPMKDFGYDVSDYCDVDPVFGTLDDFDRLVADAHERGIRVVIDWVPNHTSDQHPWFQAARSSVDDPKRDWYIWRDPKPDGSPPNNWIADFTFDSAWTLDEPSDQMYLHYFLPEQPDLNWANPEVEAAMHDTLRFWLDRGVDGFRMDVIHAIGKDPALPDNVGDRVDLPMSNQNNFPTTHEYLRRIRAVLDEYPGDRMMVGEVFLPETSWVGGYHGAGDELHLSFNFSPLFAGWRSDRWADQLDEVAAHIEPFGWPTWVLSNHDVPRHRTRYKGSEAKARAAAVVLLTLRGTPFLYAGEELGLLDGVIPPDRVVDPGGRDGCRSPIPWDSTPDHGWPSAQPWLPWPPDPEDRNVTALTADESSIVHLYRRLLALRHGSPALRLGRLDRIDAPDGTLAWARVDDATQQRFGVAVNFRGEPIAVDLAGSVVVASDGVGEGEPFMGALGPYQAVVLQ